MSLTGSKTVALTSLLMIPSGILTTASTRATGTTGIRSTGTKGMQSSRTHPIPRPIRRAGATPTATQTAQTGRTACRTVRLRTTASRTTGTTRLGGAKQTALPTPLLTADRDPEAPGTEATVHGTRRVGPTGKVFLLMDTVQQIFHRLCATRRKRREA